MTEKIKDIGYLQGELLVFGGIYSNLQALQQLQTIAARRRIPPSNIICTGDMIGYCAQPNDCLQCLKEWGIHAIAGNVEIQLRSGSDDCNCNFAKHSRCADFSKLWYPYAQVQVSEENRAWLHTLPELLCFQYGGSKVMVVHGSYHQTSEYVFKSTPWEKKLQNFSDTQAAVILAGHCGIPFHDHRAGYTWFNPGVIGMPANDGTPRVWYGLLTPEAKRGIAFTHHNFGYDHATAHRLMTERQLPLEYARTLLSGIWDNCEILPETEKAQQGKRLTLTGFSQNTCKNE